MNLTTATGESVRCDAATFASGEHAGIHVSFEQVGASGRGCCRLDHVGALLLVTCVGANAEADVLANTEVVVERGVLCQEPDLSTSGWNRMDISAVEENATGVRLPEPGEEFDEK